MPRLISWAESANPSEVDHKSLTLPEPEPALTIDKVKGEKHSPTSRSSRSRTLRLNSVLCQKELGRSYVVC